MQRILLSAAFLALLSACASTSLSDAELPPACDISRLAARPDVHPQTLCVAKALAKRCSRSDQCYIQCESNAAADGIGGGCSHVCNNEAMTDERLAREGPFLTDEALACDSK